MGIIRILLGFGTKIRSVDIIFVVYERDASISIPYQPMNSKIINVKL